MSTSIPVDVPEALIASQFKHGGASGRAWIATLPRLITDMLHRWGLRLDGPARHGMGALVLPVVCADGDTAALKLQPLNEENAGEPIGLRIWDGDGAVRLLDHDPDTGTMLLERLDATRPLSAMGEDTAAVQILAELLARLVAVPAPSGLRTLSDISTAMLDHVPRAARMLRDPDEQRLLRIMRVRRHRTDQRAQQIACCTGTCTTTTFSPGSASHGWPSTRNRSPAILVSSCSRRWTIVGTRLWPPATCPAPCSAASINSPRYSPWIGSERPAGRLAACCKTHSGTSMTARPRSTRRRSPSPPP